MNPPQSPDLNIVEAVILTENETKGIIGAAVAQEEEQLATNWKV